METSDPALPWPEETGTKLRDKIRRGERAVLVLDDSKGETLASLDPQRRLWAGVLFTPAAAAASLNVHYALQRALEAETGRKAIHFTELRTGNGPYKGWTVERRLAPMRDLLEAMMIAELPVAVVQVTPDTIRVLKESRHGVPHGPWFNGDKPDELALLSLLHLFETKIGSSYAVEITAVADRWKNADNELRVWWDRKTGEPLMNWLTPPGLVHSSTDDFPLLQYADLVAWGYLRMERFRTLAVEPDKYETQFLELLIEMSGQWKTLGIDADGQPYFKTLSELDWP